MASTSDSSSSDESTQHTCEAYNDPAADVVITTRDDYTMRIHSFYLKAHSSFFRDMLSSTISNPSATSGSQVIPLDANHKDVKFLFDVVTGSSVGDRFAVETCKRALDLCHQYEFDVVYPLILQHLDRFATLSPWATFVIASHHNRVNLARDCIASFGTDPLVRTTSIIAFPKLLAAQPNVGYLVGLFQAIVLRQEAAGVTVSLSPHWPSVADHFLIAMQRK